MNKPEFFITPGYGEPWQRNTETGPGSSCSSIRMWRIWSRALQRHMSDRPRWRIPMRRCVDRLDTNVWASENALRH
jgi:hypothetical protein